MTIPTYGTTLPGKVPTEAAEMATFFSQLPPHLKAIAVHIRNEGRFTHAQVTKLKLGGGYVPGASDIIIPGNPAFVCEMKSRSKTARVSKDQKSYLKACQEQGAFVCVALGWEAAMEAVRKWENGKT